MRDSIRKLLGKAIPAALTLVALVLLMPGEAKAQWTTGTTNINNTNTGNVGVGTSAPGAKLDVGAGSTSRGNYTDLLIGGGGNNPQIEFYGPTKSAAIQYDESAGGLVFYTSSSSWTQALFLGNTGNVGVGTASPANALHVNNASGFGFLRVSGAGLGAVNFQDNGAPQDQKLYQWRSEGGLFRMSLANDGNTALVRQNILVANSAGNVGVGTATPLSTIPGGASGMELYSSSTVPMLRVNTGVAGKNNAQVRFSGASGDNWAIGADVTTNSGSRDFHFYDFAGTPGARLTIQSSTGNLGVGKTPSSSYKLDVNGDANITGALNATGAITGATVNATYQDVAEWVPSSQKLAAGTVVVLDAEKTNHVIASTTSYDTKVAGVISERPGIALGEGGEGKALVATTGRVKVRVDATRAPIKVGDLLVTSDVEGVAMRSEPIEIGGRKIHAPGTIIGKALEPLASGTGEILVLLSLQ